MSERAYLLPDNPEPAELTCLKVYLPNDPAFVRAFFGSMDYLATWLAWERDAAKTGALAAASMKAANEKTKDEFILGGCVELSEPPYTENTPDGRTPTEATVDDALWTLHEVGSKIKGILDLGGDCGEAVDAATRLFKAKTGVLAVAAMQTLCTAMSAKTPQEREDALDPAAWLDIRNEVICTSEPVPTTGSEGDYLNWLDQLAVDIFDALDAAAEWLFDALDEAAATLTGSDTMTGIENTEGGGAGFGFGTAVCSWSVTLDLTTSQNGFVAFPGVPSPWTNGVGFEDACSGGKSWFSVINNWGQATSLTRVKAIRNTTLGTVVDINDQINLKDSGGGDLVNYVTAVNGGANVFDEWSGDQAGVHQLQITVSASGPGFCDGDIQFHTLEIDGYGFNPFE